MKKTYVMPNTKVVAIVLHRIMAGSLGSGDGTHSFSGAATGINGEKADSRRSGWGWDDDDEY